MSGDGASGAAGSNATPSPSPPPPAPPTGDQRVWVEKLGEALDCMRRGDNLEARRRLEVIAAESPFEETRAAAQRALRSFSIDPWFLVVWGISAAVALGLFVYYALLR